MFDAKYYTDKKTKLSQKAQQLQQEYLQSAFKFTNEMNDIQLEFSKIGEWEAEQLKAKKVDDMTPEELQKVVKPVKK